MPPQRPRVDAGRRIPGTSDVATPPGHPAGLPPGRRRTWWAAAVAAGVGILLQITYILVSGEARRTVTILVVLVFALAALLHAVASRGARWGLAMAAAVSSLALVTEAVGTATGVPFGAYSYTGTLGQQVADVPVIIPLAWLWMAYPCYLAGQALAGRRWGWLAGAWTLAAWDVFLDSMMVTDGHWVWADPTPALPGIPGIPLTNYAGWVATSILMMLAIGAVDRLADVAPGARPGRLPGDAVPAAVLAWTYVGSIAANLVFLSRPATAAWGAALMGVTAVPYLRLVLSERRRPGSAGT